MSPANKFWLGLLSIIILLLCISSKIFFYSLLVIHIIIGPIIFLVLTEELSHLYEDQDEYLREKERNRSDRWFNSYKRMDKSEEIAKKEFYIKISYVYWILFAIRSFNNYLNNKFSKNE